MDRRQFSKLSAMTVAAVSPWVRTVAEAQMSSASQPLRYAPVGLGTISDIFMRGCETAQKAKITGLVTGHPAEKAPKYAAKYGIPQSSIYTYETFDRIADNPNIDAVYIGLPNSMHCEYTVRAAKAGKHVLCEKPMAISSAECHTMIDACRKANVKLMIAYRVHYDPTWQQVRDIVRSGALGEVEAFQGGFYGNQPMGAWRLSRKLGGGGPLLDLGIYPLNATRWILGEEPGGYTAVTATRETSGRFAEVEQTMEWTMRMPSGILGSYGCSYGASGPSFLDIMGVKGTLHVSPAFNYNGLRISGHTTQGGVDIVSPGTGQYQFTYEADAFADNVHNNTQPESGGEEGLKDMLAMEAIYKAAGAPIA